MLVIDRRKIIKNHLDYYRLFKFKEESIDIEFDFHRAKYLIDINIYDYNSGRNPYDFVHSVTVTKEYEHSHVFRLNKEKKEKHEGLNSVPEMLFVLSAKLAYDQSLGIKALYESEQGIIFESDMKELRKERRMNFESLLSLFYKTGIFARKPDKEMEQETVLKSFSNGIFPNFQEFYRFFCFNGKKSNKKVDGEVPDKIWTLNTDVAGPISVKLVDNSCFEDERKTKHIRDLSSTEVKIIFDKYFNVIEKDRNRILEKARKIQEEQKELEGIRIISYIDFIVDVNDESYIVESANGIAEGMAEETLPDMKVPTAVSPSVKPSKPIDIRDSDDSTKQSGDTETTSTDGKYKEKETETTIKRDEIGGTLDSPGKANLIRRKYLASASIAGFMFLAFFVISAVSMVRSKNEQFRIIAENHTYSPADEQSLVKTFISAGFRSENDAYKNWTNEFQRYSACVDSFMSINFFTHLSSVILRKDENFESCFLEYDSMNFTREKAYQLVELANTHLSKKTESGESQPVISMNVGFSEEESKLLLSFYEKIVEHDKRKQFEYGKWLSPEPEVRSATKTTPKPSKKDDKLPEGSKPLSRCDALFDLYPGVKVNCDKKDRTINEAMKASASVSDAGDYFNCICSERPQGVQCEDKFEPFCDRNRSYYGMNIPKARHAFDRYCADFASSSPINALPQKKTESTLNPCSDQSFEFYFRRLKINSDIDRKKAREEFNLTCNK